MLIHLVTLSALVISIVQGQLVSPCPEVLTYEPRNQEQPDRWYGEVSLTTPEDLEGLWLKIILDRKADLLGNWFAESVSANNIEYSIKNPAYTLAAGPPVLIRFFVKYNAATIVPTVQKILLNGKQICPSRLSSVTEPTLHISRPRNPNRNQNGSVIGTTSTTRRPSTWTTVNVVAEVNAEPGFNGPDDSISVLSKPNDDDFFNGDFYTRSTQNPASRPAAAVQRFQEECGTVAQRASPLISHGQNTTPGQWPWHAALYRWKGTELIYTCGGTLVSDQFIVTAAHCVTKPRTNNPVHKQFLVVYLGKYNLISFGNEVQDREIDQIIVHPEYNYTVYFNDIAILKMNSPAEITNFVRPCCLWNDVTNNIENLVGNQGTVVGWGFDENKQLSKNLMQAQMPIVSIRTCLFSNRNFFSQFIFDKNFCAGFKNGTSVCNGDSGGGMVFPKRGTRGQNTVWQLRGIVSVGVALQGEGVCDPNQYIVFTDAAKYVPWIRATIY